MITIIGISGSLRKGSFNSALLQAAVELAPPGCTIEIGDIHGIPLYDGDVEEATACQSRSPSCRIASPRPTACW